MRNFQTEPWVPRIRSSLLSLTLFLIFAVNGCAGTVDPLLPDDPPLEEKIGQMLMIGFRGLAVDESPHIVRDLKEYHLGGVVLFDYDVPSRTPVRNVDSPGQVGELVAALKSHASYPLLVAIDQEGGRVNRLKERFGFPPTLSAGYLGETDHPDTTRFHAERTARMLSELGINLNFAPVVDLNLNPDNPIIGGIDRSFSADPHQVVRHARIFSEAHRRAGVRSTLKHFPGHGSSEDDSHLGMVDVTGLWSESELIPYRELIRNGDAELIMTAHIFNQKLDEDHPATLSRKVITGILREELGFDGVVVSDDMQMDAVRSYYGVEKAIELAIHDIPQ